MPARPGKISAKRLKGTVDPSQPLRLAQRELFAQMIAEGVPAPDAYRRAGYSGSDDSRWDLRRAVDVNLRVNWLLAERIRANTARRHKSEKIIDDLRTRVLRELECIAFADVRNLVQWDRKPLLANDGTAVGFCDELTPTPSHQLTAGQAAAVKSVTAKGGSIKIDVHDKLAALDKLARVLGLFQDPAPTPPSVSVHQINVGDVGALEVARRLAFVLASAEGSRETTPGPLTIDAKPETSPKDGQSK